MKIVFMGTPDFAVPSLEALLAAGHDVCAVFTQPDRPKGRGYMLVAPPVKQAALQHGLPVYQPRSLRHGPVEQILKDLAPEVIVVAAYGRILPQAVLDIPPLGCVNVHGSLLPKYRGAAPIQWAVINGEETTGVSIMRMDAGLDTGPVLASRSTPIGERETGGELFDRLKELGATLLVETLNGLAAGTLTAVAQDETQATYAPMLEKSMAQLDWSLPAAALANRVRGMNPWPVASLQYGGKRVRVFEAQVLPNLHGEPGTAFVGPQQSLCVYCAQGALRLLCVQPENKRRMTGEEFLRGHPLNESNRRLCMNESK